MSRLVRMAKRREIRKLLAAAIAQVAITSDPNETKERKEEAAQRLAEIRLRMQVLHEEIRGL